MTKERCVEVDFCRGIAAILMLLGHSFITYPVDVSKYTWCSNLEYYIFTFHMELFFVLAGVVYKCKDYRSFLRNKVLRILIPYFFFGILTMLLKAFGGSAINGVEPIGYGINKLIFHGGSYWFLYVLFIIFVIYPLLDIFSKHIKGLKIFIAVLCIVLRFVVPEGQNGLFAIELVLKHFPYFVIGNLLSSKILNEGGWKIRKTNIICISAGCIVLFVLSDWIIKTSGYKNPLEYIRAISVIILIYMLANVIKKSGLSQKIKMFIVDCSKYSLQLYLFNGFILVVLRVIICNVLKIVNPVIIVGSIWIGNLIITLIVCKYMIPYIPVVSELCGLKRIERTRR